MSLVFYLIHPRTPGISGGQIDAGPAAVRLNGVELTQGAAVGDAPISSISFDDPNGTLDVTGLWSFRVDDNSLSVGSNSALYYGFVGDRSISRVPDLSLRLGSARRITADVIDINAFLGFRMATDADANRPAETAAARLAWLLADSYAPFHDHGNVTYPTDAMDANDYRYRYFGDVLADIAAVSGYNYWLDVRQSDGQVSLFFGDFNTSTDYGSPLRISNTYSDVSGDATGWTYAPYIDAVGKPSASRVASGVAVPYSGGTVFVRSQATASNFNFRDLTAPMATVHSASAATVVASRFLDVSSTEDFAATVTIRVPVTALPLIKHGMRMQGKFSHFDAPYNDWTWYRITRRTIIQDEDTDETLRLRLDLSPQSIEPPGASIATYGTSNSNGGWLAFTWDEEPSADQMLVGFLSQRAGSTTYDSSIVPWSNLNPAGNPVVENIAGTQWTFLDGLEISTTLSYPITMAARDATVDDAITIRWGGTAGGLNGSAGPRGHHVALNGLAGTYSSVVTKDNQTDGGAVMTTPTVTATGAGYIVAGFSHAAAGPGDGFSVASVFAADLPSQMLTQGVDFAPWSGMAIQRVTAAGSYTITIRRTSDTPRNSTYAWGCIAAFFPDA